MADSRKYKSLTLRTAIHGGFLITNSGEETPGYCSVIVFATQSINEALEFIRNHLDLS